ncbi:MAG: LytTR family transcriptional regulator DNA-binding domain-containing protein [Clostridiales bacterium]|nr:LytTR family transcriptional regulator DNA-binding domain-containing protein [Clostridiales bacterium]HAW16256.1 hypothetical protein [Clostridiales bacterium]
MKLFLSKKEDLTETEIEIRYREENEEFNEILSLVRSVGERLIGIRDNGDEQVLSSSGILYFEAVERYVFAYGMSDVFKVRNTLYDLEERFKSSSFVRISKSLLVNICAVRRIVPENGRRLKLILNNGEALIVSRGYVSDLKAAIGMKGEKR